MSPLTADDLEGPGSEAATPRSPHWRRNVTLAVVGLLLATGVVAFMALSSSGSRVEAKEVGFTVDGPESITLDFSVDKPRDMTVECTVEALATDFSQVGLAHVTVGPADVSQQQVSVTIPTTQSAVSAIVKACLPPARG